MECPEREFRLVGLEGRSYYFYDRETGLLTRGRLQLETEARRAADTAIRVSALEDGILEQARVNAESYLFGLFPTLGYADVVFLPAPAEPRPAATPS